MNPRSQKCAYVRSVHVGNHETIDQARERGMNQGRKTAVFGFTTQGPEGEPHRA